MYNMNNMYSVYIMYSMYSMYNIYNIYDMYTCTIARCNGYLVLSTWDLVLDLVPGT